MADGDDKPKGKTPPGVWAVFGGALAFGIGFIWGMESERRTSGYWDPGGKPSKATRARNARRQWSLFD